MANRSAEKPTLTQTNSARWLVRLRRAGRALLIAQRLGWILAAAIALVLVAGMIDYVLRAPMALRGALWAIGLIALIAALRQVVWPAIRFNPSLTEVALRVERSAAGRRAGLEGVLASGLELQRLPDDDAGRRLASGVIDQASRRIGSLRGGALIAPSRTVRSAIWFAGALLAVGVTAAFEPTLSRIGAERVLWPFSDAQWPRRTGVVDITTVKVHPLGSALALRAALTRTSNAIDSTRVAAHYRVIDGGVAGPERRVLLTSQDKIVRLEPKADRLTGEVTTSGHLFERLLDPTGLSTDASVRGTGGDDAVTLEYWFETEDDRTETARVMLVEPPMVLGASARVQLPEYAADLAERFPELARAGNMLDLGPGNDDRAAPAPILTGSRVELTIRLNKEVPGLPELVPDARAWLERSLGRDSVGMWLGDEGDAASPRGEVRTDGTNWTISWVLTQPIRLSVKPTDRYGITATEESAYRIDTLSDNPPTAAVVIPIEDKAVLATAVVELVGEGRDDVGLDWTGLDSQVARRPAGSEGAPAEPLGEPSELVRIKPAPTGASAVAADRTEPVIDSRRLIARHTLDLSELEVKPGDEVWITAVAADAYELARKRHEVARSSIRKLRIMGRDELIEQVWSELGSVRRAAVRMDEDQRELARSVDKPGADESRRGQRAQAGITERLARQSEALDRISERISENGLADQGLESVMRQAEQALEQAGQQSNQASRSLGEAAQQAAQPDSPPQAGQAERDQAAQAQQEVRRQLAELIDTLDQGEDTYASRRAIENLVADQKALMERTAAAGQRTTGKSAQQLAPEDRQELQDIAEAQQQLAERLQDAVEKMQDREQKMRESDPAAAQAMAQAAQRAQRDQTADRMQQAGQQARQNQTNNAQQQQQQAIQSMEQMLEELNKAQENRDEVLRRFLSSLMDSIRALIQQQESQLAALDAATDGGVFTGLDRAMAQLHQNTLGVLDQAAGGPRDAAQIADLIERAADAQAAATVALRDNPVNADEVRAQEQLSLDKLNEALTQAEQVDDQAEQRQQDRKREELKRRYAEAMRTQVSIRDGSAALVGIEASRRTRAAARELASLQADLRTTIDAIRSDTAELSEAKVFEFAHRRLDQLMAGAADRLGEGESSDMVVRDQTSAARLLQSLVESLERARNDRPFREREGQQAGGGGGGGGPQPVVPPAAEIKLLRAMQQEAAELTRLAQESGAAPEMVEDVAGLQRSLADEASGLLKRLTERGGPSAAPPSTPPPPENPAEPAEPPSDPTPQ